MPAKASGRGTFHEIDRFDAGVGWLAHPEETMQRASHALTTEDGLYLVDPIDVEGLDDRLAALGDVAGVVVTDPFHRRDAAPIARRHDVPVSLPSWLTTLADADVAAPVDRVDRVGDYEFVAVADTRLWQEAALWNGETLYVADALGTADYFLAPGERLGVLSLLRFTPPREPFGDLVPTRILCGHGAGIHDDAADVLAAALANARKTAFSCYRHNLGKQMRSLYAAVTT